MNRTVKNKRFFNIKIGAIALIIVLFVSYRRYRQISGLTPNPEEKISDAFETSSTPQHSKVLTSSCECRTERIRVREAQPGDHYVIESSSATKNFTYKIEKLRLASPRLSCDLYNALRRGPNLKVISYSLYGRNEFYYGQVKSLIKRISEYYPDWIVRIHHDSSIRSSFKCEIECLQKEDGKYYDLVDFCNIEQLPVSIGEQTWNASYMHGMTWRWLPIGDSFVDFVGSRDTDAWIHQRELDSVNVWLASNTTFHIMRDAPVHDIMIVGGYWGFANVRSRELAAQLHDVLTDRQIAARYNHIKNKKQDDQLLLTDHFAKHAALNSTSHDAFLCVKFGGQPWPTQRPAELGFCFVGCGPGCCDQVPLGKRKNYTHICPPACRPKNHQDWIHC